MLHSNTVNKARIDAESYSKAEAKYSALLAKSKCEALGNLAYISDGNHLSIAEGFSISDGVRYLRGQDISSEMMLDDRNPVFIPDSEYKKLGRSHIFKEDLLITIVGANTGFTALVYEAPNKLTANCKLGIIRVGVQQELPAAYLHAFLAGNFGQYQIRHAKRGGGQMGLILPDLKALSIARFRPQFEQSVADVSGKGHKLRQDAKNIFVEAEQILLCFLRMEGWQPANQNAAIKKFSQSFVPTGRLDAEYYQPKYDELITKLESVETAKLGDLVSIRKSIEPGSDAYGEEGLPFLRIADVSKYGITRPSIHVSPDVAENIEELKPKKDTILLSKDGSVGIAYKLEEDFEGITSGALLHLRVTDESVLPDYLNLVLNSITTQMQAERDAGGSIIQHWRPEQIREVVIPILPSAVQQNIAEKVQTSFAARRQSQQLLELAKQTVERAIENSEDEALRWLQAQLH